MITESSVAVRGATESVHDQQRNCSSFEEDGGSTWHCALHLVVGLRARRKVLVVEVRSGQDGTTAKV